MGPIFKNFSTRITTCALTWHSINLIHWNFLSYPGQSIVQYYKYSTDTNEIDASYILLLVVQIALPNMTLKGVINDDKNLIISLKVTQNRTLGRQGLMKMQRNVIFSFEKAQLNCPIFCIVRICLNKKKFFHRYLQERQCDIVSDNK